MLSISERLLFEDALASAQDAERVLQERILDLEREVESKERELIFSKLPYIDAVLIPGGDPGDQEPEVLFKWGEIQQNLLCY